MDNDFGGGLGGGLGSLPNDLFGSDQKHLNFYVESVGHDTLDLDKFLEAMPDGKIGKTGLIPNNEFLHGIRASEKAVDKNDQKIEAIRIANWNNIMNEPVAKAKQHLENSVEKNFLTQTEASILLADRPFHGELYLDRNAVCKCSEVRKAAEKSAARHVLWIVSNSECELCKQKYGFCPETGKKLLANVPTTKTELKEAVKHLKERGKILSNSTINNWSDLRDAMSDKAKERESREYPHSVPVIKHKAESIDKQRIEVALKNTVMKNKKQSEDMQQEIADRKILPIARHLGELLLKGTGWAIARQEVNRLFPEKKLVQDAIAYIKKNADPALLVTHLAAFPSFYNGNCEMCRDFLRKNTLKVVTVFPITACADCHWRENALKTCSLIGAKIMENGVEMKDVDKAITELQVKGKLSSSQVKELNKITIPQKRLTEAVRLAYIDTKSDSKSLCEAAPVEQNAIVLSTANFALRENAVEWSREQLTAGATISQVKRSLACTINDAENVLQEAVQSLKSIHASSIDNCMAENKYVFCSGAIMIKAKKCYNCKDCDTIGCKKHGLFFCDIPISDIKGSREATDILSYFEDSSLEIDVKPVLRENQLNFEIPNEGQGMVIETGDGRKEVREDLSKYFDGGEMTVDINPSFNGLGNLNVSGVASGGEAWDLSTFF